VNKRRASYYLAAFVSLITLVVYLSVLRNDFVSWDDDAYVMNNYHILSLNWTFMRWAFFSFYESNWHPLTWVSHALDYAVWGLNPLGHHLTNIVLHAINTSLVVVLCIRLMKTCNERSAPDKKASTLLDERRTMIAAGVAGLLFGLHPVHVESVAWVSERKDLLCGLFYLLSISAYVKYIRIEVEEKKATTRFFNKAYLASLLFFILALLSKPMAVSLPAVLLIFDWYPFQRIRSLKSFRDACVEKLPFIVCSLISSILTIMAQRTEEAMTMMAFVPLWARLLVAVKSVAAYLGKMAVPLGLSPFYPYPKPREVTLLSPRYFFAVILVVGISTVLLVTAKKQKVWLSAWGYYVVTLIPVSGIIQVGTQAMADRYIYLPSLGPFFLLGLSTAWVWARADSLKKGRQSAKWFTVAVGISLLISLSIVTLKQIVIWKNSMGFWSYVIAKEPNRFPIAYNNRGLAFQTMGQFGRAIQDYTTAITLNPVEYLAYRSRGIAYYEMGQLDRAIEDFTAAIMLRPTRADLYASRGLVFEAMGQFDNAMEDLNKAITLDPSSVDAYLNRGVTFEHMNQLDRAVEDYDKTITLNPSDFLAYTNRGIAFNKMGRVEKAIEDFDKALSLNPSFVKAYIERGDLYQKLGKTELAMRDNQKACSLGSEEGCEALRTYGKQ
jgi:tetratricopeptide (TPR) repeat protein